MDNRYRPNRSPPPGRRYPQDPRVSTGFISTSYEPAYSSYPRSAIEPSSYSQSRHSSIYDPTPYKRYAYNDSYGGPVSRTQYPAASFNRPRNNSAVVTDNRRPVSMYGGGGKNMSPPRYKPIVSNTPRDRPRTPPNGHNSTRDDSSKYLVPARSSGSDHHQRHYSANRADVDRLIPAGRASKRAEYHQPGGYNTSSKGYAGARGIKDDDFSYTGPREQFARDYPDRGPPPRDPLPRDLPPPRERDRDLPPSRDMPPPRDLPPVRRERPVSVMDPLDLKSAPLRREPLPPSRQPDRLDPVRRSVYDDLPDRSSDLPQRRHSMRQPVVHQPPLHDLRDDGRGPLREIVDRSAPKVRRERYDEDELPPKLRQRDIDPAHDRDQDLRRERDRDRPRDRDREYVKERERDRDPREREHREREREKDRDIEPERERDRDRDRERDRDRGDRDKDRHRRSEKKERYSDDDREQRATDGSAEHSSSSKVAAAGLAGVATAGIANAVLKSKKAEDPSDSDERKERRRRRHHHKEREDAEPEVIEPDASGDAKVKGVPEADDHHGHHHRDSGYGTSRREESGDSPDDEHVKRRHHRRHRDREAEEAPAEDGLLQPRHHADRDVSPGDDGSGHHRRREKSRSRDIDPQRTISPGDEDDGRKRRVTLVEPEKKEEFKPRGILKPQRTTPFPEDPNPTREGVAPLKESGKHTQPGIPDGARWTKISRMLVNPEALEKYHERFEEREEYVIVLRVLTREEITKFAEKTQEIRAERERQWKEQVEHRRITEAERRREPDGRADDEDYDEDNMMDAPRAAIDSKPAEPGLDPQVLINPPEQEPIAAPAHAQVPEIKLDDVEAANYSTNV